MKGNIYELVKACIGDYDLITPGDRVLMGLSGGKDSLTCLMVLEGLREELSFDLCACFVAYPMEEITKDIKLFLNKIGIKLYEILPQDVPEKLNCNRCAHIRRKTLLECAYSNGFNKVAIGHNYEDNAETALLNLFTGQGVEKLSPKRVYFDKITLIRPLLYVREKKIISYVLRNNLPVCENKCENLPNCGRIKIREILKELSLRYPKIYENILKLNNVNKREMVKEDEINNQL